ncbi:hypothetical protein K9M50_00715 [Patescibacteria group bacterium]|nr:hypothetical protein [Patescibacteria group bacterium]
MFDMSKIENSMSAFENTGNRLETEFIGNINKTKYNQMAYEYLFGNPAKKEKDPDEKFAKTLKFKEEAERVFENTLALSDKDKYIDFKNSMNLVEKSQIGDPENPNLFFAKNLLNTLRDKFTEDKYIIKFFTATGGTHLDVKHKIDCFFKIYDKESGEELSYATVDLSSNPKKQDCRADVLINISNEDKSKFDNSRNNDEFDKSFVEEKMSRYADDISDAIVKNYKNNN